MNRLELILLELCETSKVEGILEEYLVDKLMYFSRIDRLVIDYRSKQTRILPQVIGFSGELTAL